MVCQDYPTNQGGVAHRSAHDYATSMNGRNHLHHGDCIAGMAQLAAGSVDLVFADPPFNIGYDYDVYDDRNERRRLPRPGREPGASRSTACSSRRHLLAGDRRRVRGRAEGASSSASSGFACRSWVIWYYTFGVNCTKKFSRSHAHLFHFVKDPKKFTFNARGDPRPLGPAARLRRRAGRTRRAACPTTPGSCGRRTCPRAFEPDEDTWYFPRVCGTFKERAGLHGCQMPEQLLGRIIDVSSNPGELVLDPFAGSGTTLVVAKKLGRDYLGLRVLRQLRQAHSGPARRDPRRPTARRRRRSQGQRPDHRERQTPRCEKDRHEWPQEKNVR